MKDIYKNIELFDIDSEIIETKKTPMERYTREMFGEEKWISIEDIHVDIDVQRELQETHVDKIVAGFDPTAFGRITVTQRESGAYFCTNGQHRLKALERMGFSHAPCIIVSLCSLKDEGVNFININEQSAKVTNLDKYRIGVSAEVTSWLRTKEVLDYAGLEVGSNENKVSCVSVIHKYVNNAKLETSRERDMNTMKTSLLILKELYGGKGVINIMVSSMCLFVRYYIDSGDTTAKEVVSKLKHTNYKDFSSKANALKESTGGRGKINSYVAYLMYAEYNKNLKTNRLPLKINL